MKYWAYLFGKLLIAGALLAGVYGIVRGLLPPPDELLDNRFNYDLLTTGIAWTFWMLGFAAAYFCFRDQRYRCRTCLRRLRMPIARGSWTGMLIDGRPHTEYICPYGHGTLKVPEVHITGKEPIDWAEHQDIWKELETIGSGKG